MPDKKRQPRRKVEVTYYDPETGEYLATDLITAAPFIKWGEIAQVQKLILEIYVEVAGDIPSLFSNDRFLSLCKKLSALIPVVPDKRPIDFQALIDADDWPQILRLFVTTSINEEGEWTKDEKGNPELIKPGIIADLHNLNFLQIVIDLERERQKLKEKEKEAEESEVVATTK